MVVLLHSAQKDLNTLYMYFYVGQYPGSNDQEISTLGAEETNSLLEESQCEG